MHSIKGNTSCGSPVLKAYTFFSTFSAFSFWLVIIKNFGLSGKIEKMIPFNKFTAEMQIMYKRHGLKSIEAMCNVQSIGIIKIAGIELKIDTETKNSVAKATARGANAGVWNSLTYEYAAVWDPANLWFSKRFDVYKIISFLFILNLHCTGQKTKCNKHTEIN